MKERRQHCCAGPSGALRIRRHFSSCDDEEALNFAAADRLTVTLVNNAGTQQASLARRLVTSRVNKLHAPSDCSDCECFVCAARHISSAHWNIESSAVLFLARALCSRKLVSGVIGNPCTIAHDFLLLHLVLHLALR